MKAENKEIYKRIAAAGNEVHFLSKEEVAAWKKALMPLYDKYGPEIGVDLIKRMEKEINSLSK